MDNDQKNNNSKSTHQAAVQPQDSQITQVDENSQPETALYESVLHHANIWINTCDENSRILLWNKTAENISGYSADEVLGNASIWKKLLPDKKIRKDFLSRITAIKKNPEINQNYETTIETKMHQQRLMSWQFIDIGTGPPQSRVRAIIGQDISKQKSEEKKWRINNEHISLINEMS